MAMVGHMPGSTAASRCDRDERASGSMRSGSHTSSRNFVSGSSPSTTVIRRAANTAEIVDIVIGVAGSARFPSPPGEASFEIDPATTASRSDTGSEERTNPGRRRRIPCWKSYFESPAWVGPDS